MSHMHNHTHIHIHIDIDMQLQSIAINWFNVYLLRIVPISQYLLCILSPARSLFTLSNCWLIMVRGRLNNILHNNNNNSTSSLFFFYHCCKKKIKMWFIFFFMLIPILSISFPNSRNYIMDTTVGCINICSYYATS